MGSTLSMVIEGFKNGDAVPVYRRVRERGRMALAGLTYVSSWVSEKLGRRYQVMETEDRAFMEQWMANWSDLVDFEISSRRKLRIRSRRDCEFVTEAPTCR